MTAAYAIEQRGDQWLLTADRTRVLGYHATEAAARAQARAVLATHDYADLHALHDVEIFRTGTWNGDPYTEDDLDAMVTAAGQVGFGIPIKAGHRDEAGEPALGWVENLRRNGTTLLGDLVALPGKVFEAIKDRAYDAVSAEIFWDLERNGSKYPRALKALALLGAEIPAVDLKPLRDLFSAAVIAPPATPAERYAVDLKLAAASPVGQDAHHDAMMGTRSNAAEDKGEAKPDAKGNCPPGYEKDPDGSGDCIKKGSKKNTEPTVARITRAQMADLCPTCAEQMQAKNIAVLKIPRQADGTYDFSALKDYQGFNQGLCDKFGDPTGFRTRCMDAMGGKVDDEGAFCNALKIHCHGSASAENSQTTTSGGGAVHTAPTTERTMATTTHEVRDGEIVVTMSEIQELRRKAEKADRLEPLEASLTAEKAKNDEIEAKRREDRITYKMRDVKLPVFRPYIRALYEIATASPQVKQYAVADRKGDAEHIVEMLVEEINKQAAHLFVTLSTTDPKKQDPDEPEDLQAKVDYRVRAYCRANKLDYRKDYKTAVNAVLAADPDLKVEYSRS